MRNALLFCGTFLACVVALLNLNSSSPDNVDSLIQAMDGDILCKPGGGNWADPQESAIVIVTDHDCPACVASRDLDAELTSYGKANDISVYRIRQGTSFSESPSEVGTREMTADLRKFGVVSLPTFMRVRSDGLIESMWTGSVPNEDHNRVFDSIVSGRSLDRFERISSSEFNQYPKDNGYQIIAISEIGLREGTPTKVIPAGEIGTRARYELDRDVLTFVDCDSSLNPGSCQNAALLLLKQGFNVVMIGLPKRQNFCAPKG